MTQGPLVFEDPVLDGEVRRVLVQVPVGGADIGEVLAIAGRVDPADRRSWWKAWSEAAQEAGAFADDRQRRGHRISAREHFLKAAAYDRAGEFFLRVDLDDPQVNKAAGRIRRNFRRACELFDHPAEPVEIPFEDIKLPGYFLRPADDGQARATVIMPGGYDSYAEEYYGLGGAALLARDFNVLMFDGPGQGQVLRRKRRHLRPDFETVMAAVVDWALERPEVDDRRLAAVGRSLGGYLVARAMTREPRLAAFVADPGLVDLGRMARRQLPRELELLLEMGHDEEFDARIAAVGEDNPAFVFALRSRMAAHGLESPMAYFQELDRWVVDAPEAIQGAAIVVESEGDTRAQSRDLFDALTCARDLIKFSLAEGAGGHCAMGTPLLFNARAFDRLREVLG